MGKTLISLLFLIIVFLFPQKIFASVVINEFLVDPDSDQWVELYNNSDSSIDISGWFIDDNGGTQKFTIPPETQIEPRNYKVFESTSFNLNRSSADEIRLINGSATIDSYSYSTGPGTRYTYGRTSDGGNNWAVFNNPTKGSSNNSSNPLPTPTPTPLPTPTPVKTPTPFKSSTTTKSSNSNTSLSNKNEAVTITNTKLPSSAASRKTTSKSINLNSIMPTPILGISSKSADKKSSQDPSSKNTKVDNAKQNIFVSTALMLGPFFIISCGILVFRQIRKNKKL